MSEREFHFLLLQSRDRGDAMRQQEVECFARSLDCRTDQFATHDLITSPPTQAQIDAADVVLLGGSGDYSVVAGGDWLDAALATMAGLYESGKPTFASCWGFQAFARALGARVVTDKHRAELGTIDLKLTEAGQRDPVFGFLPPEFPVQLGHQDIVDELPADAILLASSDQVDVEAFTFPGKPIYCTQFHPELRVQDFLQRLQAYPSYVQEIAGMSLDEFARQCRETPASSNLLRQFVATLRD